MEHYKGLYNKQYVHNGSYKHFMTVHGEYFSNNGTGEVVALFKLKAIHNVRNNVVLQRQGIQQGKLLKAKRLLAIYKSTL